jgi:hypothetical protein
MNRSACGKLRMLYLLALVQLVGGPLVLLHVTWFCKTTMDLAPKCGLKHAALVAWHDSGERINSVSDPLPLKKEKAPVKSESGKAKMPPAFWQAPVFRLVNQETRHAAVWLNRVWTPAWPQAPPGPPPRLG